MHLVNENDGALQQQAISGGRGLLHGLTDILDAAQHGADGDELCIERIGHEACNGGLAHPWRAPQDATVRLARLERQAQRHAWPQNMLLPNDFAQLARSQALGQGLVGQA